MVKMDDKLLLVLAELRRDSRKSMTEMARSVGMPISTMHDRVKELQQEMIKKHTCVVDFSKLGFSCRIQVILKVRKEDKDQIREHLIGSPNVNTIYRINNGYDFLVEGVFRDMKEADRFVERLDEKFRIPERRVYYILDDIAREVFLTDPVHLELVDA